MKRPVSWKVRIREAEIVRMPSPAKTPLASVTGDPLRLPSAATPILGAGVLPPSVQAT